MKAILLLLAFAAIGLSIILLSLGENVLPIARKLAQAFAALARIDHVFGKLMRTILGCVEGVSFWIALLDEAQFG